MSSPSPQRAQRPSIGRPRAFAPDAALQDALATFWRQGYEATSLDDLTQAMGLSRSSFYACFGSKHAVLIASVRAYADERFAAMQALAAAAPDPRLAVRAVLAAIADAESGDRGCLLVNAVIELAPRDPKLTELARAHLARVEAIVAGRLVEAGFPASVAGPRAGALLACAIGATMLCKAGMASERVMALLSETDALLRA